MAAYSADPDFFTASWNALQKPNAFLVDVRTTEKRNECGLPNSINIPLQVLASAAHESMDMLPSDRETPIIVYCDSGKRAHRAQQVLNDFGFTDVTNGGAWSDVGFAAAMMRANPQHTP